MTRDREGRWPHRALRLLGWLTACAVTAVLLWRGFELAYYEGFSVFQAYDDEGYLMLTVRQFLDGQALYDDVYSQYGPFYYCFKALIHGVAGLPVTHDLVRLTTVVLRLSTALLCSAAVWRMTRSLPLLALTFCEVVLSTSSIANEPGHPQEVCLFLLGAALFLSTLDSLWRGRLLSLVLFGAVAGALLFTKSNVGAFFLLSMMLAASALVASRAARVVAPWVGLAAVLLPFVLMRAHLGTWAWRYAIVVGVSVVATLPALRTLKVDPRLNAKHVLTVCVGFVGALAAMSAVLFVRGTSPWGLFDGIFLSHVDFASRFTFPWEFPYQCVPWLIVPLTLALAYGLGGEENRVRRFLRDSFFPWFKLLAGVLIIYESRVKFSQLLAYGAPYLWIVLVPRRGRDSWKLSEALPRVTLCTMALLQTMTAYPVAGTHRQSSTFLILPFAAICLFDGWRDVRESVQLLSRSWTRVAGLAVTVLLMWGYDYVAGTSRARAGYVSQVPLNLPGARRVRLPAPQVAVLQWVSGNLAAHGDSFVSRPGLPSFFFWSGLVPPNGVNPGAWPVLLDSDTQAGVIDAASRHERLVALVCDGNLWEWEHDASTTPLARFIDDEFVPSLRAWGYEIRVRLDRDEPVENYLMFGRKEFSGPEDAIFVPGTLVTQATEVTVRCRIRTCAPGVVLGYQSGDFTVEPGEVWAPILYVGEDGRLRGQFWNGSKHPIESRVRVDDDRWHTVALSGCCTRGCCLFLDGRLVGTCPGELAHEDLMNMQVGAGYTESWPGGNGGLLGFVGEIENVVVEPCFNAEPLAYPLEIARPDPLGAPGHAGAGGE